MTQPGFAPIQRLYSRALNILGVATPGTRQLVAPLAIQQVNVVSDLSDAAEPHSVPIFGMVTAQGAVIARRGAVAISATSRLVRVRQIFITAGADVRMAVLDDAAPIDTIVTTIAAAAIGGLGPFGTGRSTPTAIVTAGTNDPANLPLSSFLPELAQFDVRPPLLLTPGTALVFEDQTANDPITLGAMWEEIPGQIETADIGFPENL